MKDKRLRKINEGASYLFEKGDVVYWEYTHHLNSKSSFVNTKKGVFIRNIEHPKRSDQWWTPLSLVQFKGNKNPSRVRRRELFLEEITNENSNHYFRDKREKSR